MRYRIGCRLGTLSCVSIHARMMYAPVHRTPCWTLQANHLLWALVVDTLRFDRGGCLLLSVQTPASPNTLSDAPRTCSCGPGRASCVRRRNRDA